MTFKQATLAALAATISLSAFAGASYADDHKGKHKRQGQPLNFEQLDADGDGFITKAEIQANADKRFAETDTDGNGTISKEELQTSVEARMEERKRKAEENRKAKRMDKMFGHMDKNSDGEISKDEMPDGGDKFFDRVDENKDGKISKEEAEKVKKHRKGKKDRKSKD